MEWQFTVFPHQFQVNFSISKLMNISTQELYEIRRLAFSPLMPLLVRWVIINYIYWNSYLIDSYRRRLISSHWFIQTDSYLIIQTETHTYSLIYVYRLRLMPIHWFIQTDWCLIIQTETHTYSLIYIDWDSCLFIDSYKFIFVYRLKLITVHYFMHLLLVFGVFMTELC